MDRLKKSIKKSLIDFLTETEDSWFDISDLRLILESTMTELKTQAWPRVAARVKSQHLKSEYLGVTKEGIIKFRTTSGTIKGKWWYQDIFFEDLPEVAAIMAEDPKFTARDGLLLAMKGNVKVHCNDPSWLYWGWKYIGTKKKYALRKETRYPKIRNPKLTGSVCKHLLSVFRVIPFSWSKIVRDLKHKGYLPDNKKVKSAKVA